MPNWCSNSISISGPVAKIQAIWDAAQADQSGLLNALVPMPVALRDTIKGTGDENQTELHDGFTNWYDWSVSRWGTKWDVDTEGLHFEDLGNGQAQILGGFESAWSPPVEAFQAYANVNPDVEMELKYFEPGMGFVGVWDSLGGDAYWDDVGGLILQEAENDDEVLQDLFEVFNVWDWYEVDPDDEENLEIDLDGGISAINED